jgi:carbon monoxide dehydrogenase subunit G
LKLHEEFTVPEDASTLWKFFEQSELVAGCMPGVEQVEVVDADNLRVRATQRIGPMSATFDARVKVLDRVPEEFISFEAVGKSVRGAVGNLRTLNRVQLAAAQDGTVVVVDSDVALAGALGSVGQKVVAKQASKITAEFAHNLQRALAGDGAGTPTTPEARTAASVPAETTGAVRSAAATARAGRSGSQATGQVVVRDPWSRAAAALSALSAAVSIFVAVRTRRGRG